jgi:hypothetical protein
MGLKSAISEAVFDEILGKRQLTAKYRQAKTYMQGIEN